MRARRQGLEGVVGLDVFIGEMKFCIGKTFV